MKKFGKVLLIVLIISAMTNIAYGGPDHNARPDAAPIGVTSLEIQ